MVVDDNDIKLNGKLLTGIIKSLESELEILCLHAKVAEGLNQQ